MESVLRIVVPLLMMGVAGFQALFPERLIRFNNRMTLWQPQWAKRLSLHPVNIAGARLAGIAVFVMAAVFFVDGIASLFGAGFLARR